MSESLNIIDFPANTAPAPGDIEYFRRPGTDYTAPLTPSPPHPVTPSSTTPPVPDPIHLPDGTELRLTLSKKLWLNRLFGDDTDHWDGPATLIEHVSVLFLAACPPDVFRRLGRCPETGEMLPLIRRPYDFQTALDSFADTYLAGYTIDEIVALSREFWEQQHCTRVIAKKKIPLHSPAPTPPPPMTTMTLIPSPRTGPSNSSTSPPEATPSAARSFLMKLRSPSSTPKSTAHSTPPTSPPSAPPPPSPASPASPPPSPQPKLSEDDYIAAIQAAGHVLYANGHGDVDRWRKSYKTDAPSTHHGVQCTLCHDTYCLGCRCEIDPCPAAHPDNEPLTEVDSAAAYEGLRRITAEWPVPAIGETRTATLARGTSYTLTGRFIKELTDSGPETYLTWDLGGLCFGKWPLPAL